MGAVSPAAMAATEPEAGNRLPVLGDAASEGLDVNTERRLGDLIMRDIRRDADYLDDPVLLDYLQSVWQPLVAAARARGDISPELEQRFAWEPFLVRDKSVNAFALPGGFVGVHLGLIAMTATRDELASVLGHEMTHVTQRHIARSIANSKRQSIMSAAAMIIGVLAAARSPRSDAPNAVLAGGQALALQGQLNFSRDMEREADRIGFSVMTNAGFAPDGMAAMFEKLDHNSRLNDGGGYPYLRSHPLTTERIGEARSRLGTAAPVAPVSALAHVAMQARSRVMMDPRIVPLQHWQDQRPSEKAGVEERLLVAYTVALASTLMRDWPRADEALGQARALVRGSPRGDARAEREVALLTAQSHLERGDRAAALQDLQPYRSSPGKPASRPVMMLAAQTVLAAPQQDPDGLKRTADELQTWTADHPNDALAWGLLSRCWEAQGAGLRALRADAESRAALGDFAGAVDRLKEGQRRARSGKQADFIEASVIDSRLRAVEAEKRKQDEDRAAF